MELLIGIVLGLVAGVVLERMTGVSKKFVN